jgi:hypothetical protein
LYAAGFGQISLSRDTGATWTPVNIGLSTPVRKLAANSLTVFAGTSDGIFRSTDEGANWNLVDLGLTGPISVLSFEVVGTTIFVSLQDQGVFLSSDNGTTWTPVHTNLPGVGVHDFAVLGMDIFAATDLYGVWRRPLPEMIPTAVAIGEQQPLRYALFQNHPNPFNPSTEIRYQISEVSRVSLKVYDVLGREVATLVDEIQDTGYKSVRFDASNLSSGVYVYRLQVGEHSRSMNMILIR